MRTINIPYGPNVVPCELPELERLTLLNQDMPQLEHPQRALRDALSKLTAKPDLRRMLEGKTNALIIVDDGQRYAAYELWLAWLLDELNMAGLEDRYIKLYIASGERPAPDEARRWKLYGSEVCRRLGILSHDCTAVEQFTKIGRTDAGTTVLVDNRVLNADLLILASAISYDALLGYSGGPTSLTGLCVQDSIEQQHSRAWNAGCGELPQRTRPGIMSGNPMNEELQAGSNLLRPDLSVNVLLNNDGAPAWFGAGDPNYVYRIGAGFLDTHKRPQLEVAGDIAVLGSGGDAGDGSLFSAYRALGNIAGVLQSGATVFWLAKCSNGEGSDELTEWRKLDLEQCRRRLSHAPTPAGIAAFAIKQFAAEFQVHLVSDLPEELVREWGLIPHHDLSQLWLNLPARATSRQWIVAPNALNLLPEIPAAAKTMQQLVSVSGE